MVGNRDWFFHLPLAVLTPVRQLIAERFALANAFDQPFPHDVSENEELLLTMRRHKVTARHGDLYDPLAFEGDRDCSSLDDAMVIELIDRFAAEVTTPGWPRSFRHRRWWDCGKSKTSGRWCWHRCGSTESSIAVVRRRPCGSG